MSQISEFADAYHRYRQSTDHHRLLWMGDLDQIEHWEDVTPDGLTRRIDELRNYADRADRIESSDVEERALAETISFTARSAANQLIWRSELEFPNPAIGLVSTILTFLPRYSLVTRDHGERYHEKLRSLPSFLEAAGAAYVPTVARSRSPGISPRRSLRSTRSSLGRTPATHCSPNPLRRTRRSNTRTIGGARPLGSSTNQSIRRSVGTEIRSQRPPTSAAMTASPACATSTAARTSTATSSGRTRRSSCPARKSTRSGSIRSID